MSFGKWNVDWQQRIDMDALRKYRIDRTNKIMKKYGIGTLYLASWDSQRYLTGMSHHPYHRHLPDSPVLMLQDAGFPYRRYEEGVALCMPWMKDRLVGSDVLDWPTVYRMHHSDVAEPKWAKLAEQVKVLMKKHGVADLPLGIDWTGPYAIHAFEKAGIEVVDGNACILEADMVKCDEEIECMRQSASCVEAGYGAVVDKFRIGMREVDVVNIMQNAFTEAGAEYAEGWCLASGPRPHSLILNWSDRIIRPHEFLGIEACHVRYNGYSNCYDRTFFVGDDPDQLQKELYAALVELSNKFRSALKPGVTNKELYKMPFTVDLNNYPALKAREKDLRRALEQPPSRGPIFHGMGIRWHNAPMPEDFEVPLQHNMVITNHCMAHIEDPNIPYERIGASVENTYRITDTGIELLTRWPMQELMIIGKL